MPARRNYLKQPKPGKNIRIVSGEIILLDSKRIRKKVLSACKRARTTFEKAEMEFQEFETVIEPAFERWRRQVLGRELQEVEGLKREIGALHQKLAMLDQFEREYGCSPGEALEMYEEVMRARKEPETEEEMREFEKRRREAEEAFAREQERQQKFLEEMEKALKRFLKQSQPQLKKMRRLGFERSEMLKAVLEVFAIQEALEPDEIMMLMQRPEVEELLRSENLLAEAPSGKNEEPNHEANVELRIKQLAREMAFKLHPDQCGEHDESKLELWHRVQRAVQAKDLDELEVLHAHMQVLLGDVSPNVSVSRLQELTEMYRGSRAALRRKLRSFRNRPAWGFHQAGQAEKDRLQNQLARELREDKKECRHTLKQMSQALEFYEQAKKEDDEEDDAFEDLFEFLFD